MELRKGPSFTCTYSFEQEIIPAGIEKEMVREPSALEAVMSYGEDDCAEDGIEVTEKAAGNK